MSICPYMLSSLLTSIIKCYLAFLLASIAQMSRLYTYVRNEMVASEHKIADELLSGSFIFVPYSSTLKHEDVINGVFLSPEEVCWHDPTGTVDLIKEKQSCNPAGLTQHLLNKALCNVYPGFYDFFVKMCGVHEGPSSSNYLEILKELSTLASPSEAANAVSNFDLSFLSNLEFYYNLIYIFLPMS